MRNFLSILLLVISFNGYAYIDTLAIPMKDGIVFYEKEYTLDNGAKQDKLYGRALAWFTKSFQGTEKNIKLADKKDGKLVATGAFKVIVSESGNYYWLKPVIQITVKDGSYTFQAYDYYEKPIEKGITNDYSKIEYRWRDFRKGKPWSSEDQKLFEGLEQNTLSLMASLEKDMKK